MHKVIVQCLVEALASFLLRVEQMNGVPTHVRNGLVLIGKYVDFARYDAQTRGGALSGGLEKHLQADAYPEIRPARDDILS
jgi:hypothetical protein